MLREQVKKKKKCSFQENGHHFQMKSMPSEYLFGWNHRLYTQMVERAGFWSCKVQVQGPSEPSSINWCEFKLCCGSGNFPQCKLCILGLCFKEKKRSLHGTSRYGLVPGPSVPSNPPPPPGAERFNVDPVG